MRAMAVNSLERGNSFALDCRWSDEVERAISNQKKKLEIFLVCQPISARFQYTYTLLHYASCQSTSFGTGQIFATMFREFKFVETEENKRGKKMLKI